MLGAALLLDLAIHCLVGVWSAIYATEKPFDATGTVAFLTLSLGSLAFGGFFHMRQRIVAGMGAQVVVTAMVCAWTIRLGTFLVVRIARFGSDSRFDGMRERPAAVMVAYTFSAVWVFLTSLPAVLLNGVATNPGLQPLDILGGAVWLCGLALESLADAQKLRFKSQPENKGKFINVGLWRLARFPNYGGEILVWSGLYLVCCSAFSGWQYASVVSPVFVSLLLLNGSGVPLQQKQARARWGSDPAYQEYERSTRLLFPLPKFGVTKSERSD